VGDQDGSGFDRLKAFARVRATASSARFVARRIVGRYGFVIGRQGRLHFSISGGRAGDRGARLWSDWFGRLDEGDGRRRRRGIETPITLFDVVEDLYETNHDRRSRYKIQARMSRVR
jgi:hypothetical protein